MDRSRGVGCFPAYCRVCYVFATQTESANGSDSQRLYIPGAAPVQLYPADSAGNLAATDAAGHAANYRLCDPHNQTISGYGTWQTAFRSGIRREQQNAWSRLPGTGAAGHGL